MHSLSSSWSRLNHLFRKRSIPRSRQTDVSIAETNYLRLGGVEQWVMIRGQSIDNPPLILLHGGPGFSETHFFLHFNAPLEKAFTVVYWDQRGCGKSFDRWIPGSSLAVEQFVTDLDELVDWTCKRVGQRKVAILGHSWGSILGVLYAARFPEKVAAYAGAAQIGDWPAAEALSYANAVKEAHRRHHRKALKELRAIGPPPYSASSMWTERTWWQRLDGEMTPRALWKFARRFLGKPEISILDLAKVMRSFRRCIDVMWDEVWPINLIELVPALQMPVFFFVGRRDRWVPPETSVAYFEKLDAPAKTLLFFEKSGHEAFVDEPEKFNQAMVELVRPVC